jgi:hypothetical protein
VPGLNVKRLEIEMGELGTRGHASFSCVSKKRHVP